MKIRSGFVSNSSASSFIIAIAPQIERQFCCTDQPFFLDQIRKSEFSDMGKFESTQTISRDFDNIVRDIKDNEWATKKHNSLERMGQLYHLCHWEIAHIMISYHDHSMLDALDNEVNNGHIEILFGEYKVY